MKRVIAAEDIRDLLKSGGDIKSLPADAIYTPSARDLLREVRMTPGGKPSAEAAPKAGGAFSVEQFYRSPEVEVAKERICDIGRRLWQRAYVDGNGGNISTKVGDNLVLCTPTLVSKGFMKPSDICLVDMDGNQLMGEKERTSEILMHLAIMRAQPKAKACVHCHPPHATAFAVAGVKPPSCLVPEMEVFCGEVAVAGYDTPGTKEMADKVAALADCHNTILMANHGVVSWSSDVEDAYFKMEILEAYCKTVMVTSQLNRAPITFTNNQMKDLLSIKQRMGIPDPRLGLKECNLCDNQDWPWINCPVSSAAPGETPGPDPEAEALVKEITDIIIARLGQRG